MVAKKKILHLITGLELGGGAENMLLQLLPKMQDNLDNCVCAIKGKGEIGKKLEEAGIPVYYLELRNIFDIGMIFRYRNILKDFRPDIQVNYLIHADIFGRILGKIFGVKKIVPYIRNIHKSMPSLMFLDRITLFLSDFILTNSETSRRYYIEKMGVSADKIICIPNGIDLTRFENLNVNREKKLKEIGISVGSFIIGCVARLEKQKDIPTLIRAFKIVREKHPKAHLLIVGHGSQKENLKNLIVELDIENKATMLEKRTDNLELISIMNIFVLPSLNEGMSNAVIEAMASQIPVITSDVEENKELIKDNHNGMNFKNGNFKDLAKKLSLFLNMNRDNVILFKRRSLWMIKDKYRLDYALKSYKNFLLNC